MKIPDSGLYLQLLSRGRTFPLASLGTCGPIVEKSIEKVESLSLTLKYLLLSLFSFSYGSPLIVF